MKLEIKVEELFQYVSIVERVSKKRSLGNNPLLHSILLEAKDGKLILKAINNMGICVEQEASIFKEGSVLVPGSILYGLVANFPPEINISIEKLGNTLQIKSPTSEVEIEIYDEKEFPSFLAINDEKGEIFINSNILINGIESVAYASQPSISMPTLASLYIYTENNGMVFVAADTHRMAESKTDMVNTSEDISLLIPIENVPDILFLLKSIGETEVKVSFNKQHAIFSVEGIVFFTRLVDGDFPDYRSIIPKNTQTTVTMKKSDLSTLFKKVNYLSSKFKEMTIEVKSKSAQTVCTIENKGVGKITEKISSKIIGSDVVEKFNYSYINDSLQSINTDEITMSFGGDKQPMIIQNTSDKSFTYVVAPLLT